MDEMTDREFLYSVANRYSSSRDFVRLRRIADRLENPWNPRGQLPEKTDMYFVRFADEDDEAPASMWFDSKVTGWDEFDPEPLHTHWMIIPPIEGKG